MKGKEKISLEIVKKKDIKLKTENSTKNQEAIITHYLHNLKNGVSQFYKQDAIAITKEILEYKFPEEEITSLVAEEALQYGIFETFQVPFPPSESPKFKFIDLFAGIGGFRLALQNLGGKCVFTSEWDKDAKRTYKANFGETPFGDITKEDTKKFIPDGFDLLCAGFPCQAFSIAGKRGGFESTTIPNAKSRINGKL
ncbi:MAG: Type modification methyltransferase HpaII [Bacteroidota bacterium]